MRPRLRQAAHKLHGTITAFSTVAGAVASDLEDLAARGQLEAAQPLVELLEAMVPELVEQVDRLSIETLRDQVGIGGDPDPDSRALRHRAGNILPVCSCSPCSWAPNPWTIHSEAQVLARAIYIADWELPPESGSGPLSSRLAKVSARAKLRD